MIINDEILFSEWTNVSCAYRVFPNEMMPFPIVTNSRVGIAITSRL